MTRLTSKLLNRKNRAWKHLKKKKTVVNCEKARNEATNSIKQLKKSHVKRLAENVKTTPSCFGSTILLNVEIGTLFMI